MTGDPVLHEREDGGEPVLEPTDWPDAPHPRHDTVGDSDGDDGA